jgi:hypothetical protein
VDVGHDGDVIVDEGQSRSPSDLLPSALFEEDTIDPGSNRDAPLHRDELVRHGDPQL